MAALMTDGEDVRVDEMCLKPWGTAAARHPFDECGFTRPCPVHDTEHFDGPTDG